MPYQEFYIPMELMLVEHVMFPGKYEFLQNQYSSWSREGKFPILSNEQSLHSFPERERKLISVIFKKK